MDLPRLEADPSSLALDRPEQGQESPEPERKQEPPVGRVLPVPLAVLVETKASKSKPDRT